jgi:hypothetical protein
MGTGGLMLTRALFNAVPAAGLCTRASPPTP